LILEQRLLLARPTDRGFDGLAAFFECRLVSKLFIDDLAGPRHIIGEKSGSGIAYVCLDHRSTTSHLGLTTQRLELAAQLGEHVIEARQVALGRVELAKCLLLALAVLEDAGCLFDETAAFLWSCPQDAVELTLTDDDMHLAADTRVAQ